MTEFGSDFHYIPTVEDRVESNLFDLFPKASYYASGRQAIYSILKFGTWKRVWMPEYFCHHTISFLQKAGVEILFYHDSPLSDDRVEIGKIPFKKGDVLFRMNFFGLRGFRDNAQIAVPVIEDHSHDLLGEWSQMSNADWCIASLRKTLPIPEGGLIWSPKGQEPPSPLAQTDENLHLSKRRWTAMKLKSEYLLNGTPEKNSFRALFSQTESAFIDLPISALTPDCMFYLKNFDLKNWYQKKLNNWTSLSQIQSDKIEVLLPEKDDRLYPFSFIFTLPSEEERDRVRTALINRNIYPAVLWALPENKSSKASACSKRMLSIPCDARYNLTEIRLLKEMLYSVLNEL